MVRRLQRREEKEPKEAEPKNKGKPFARTALLTGSLLFFLGCGSIKGCFGCDDDKKEKKAEPPKETVTRYIRLEDFPPACKSLGINSWEKLENYPFVERIDGWKDGERQPWRIGGRLFCLIRINRPEKIEDGRKLNPHETDRFVDAIMKITADDVERQLGDIRLTLTVDDLKAIGVVEPEKVDLTKLNTLIEPYLVEMRRSLNAQVMATEALEGALGKLEVAIRSVELLQLEKLKLTQQDLTILGVKEPQEVDLEKINNLLQEREENAKAHQYVTEKLVEMWEDLEVAGGRVEGRIRDKLKLTLQDLEGLRMKKPAEGEKTDAGPVEDKEKPDAEEPEEVDLDMLLHQINALLAARRENAELHRSATDRLNDILKGLKRKVDYDYLTRVDNMARWLQEGFLITEDVETLMKERGITERKNVEFVIVNKEKIEDILDPIVILGKSAEYLKERHLAVNNRDAFLTMWRDEIPKMINADPSKEEIPEKVLKAAFERARAKMKLMGGIVDVTEIYKKGLLKGQLGYISDEVNDKTLDILYRESEIQELVLRLIRLRKEYMIEEGRANEFIHLLYDHKREGGKVSDFDPYTKPKGVLVDWAHKKLKLLSWAKWKEEGRGAQAKDRSAVVTESTDSFFKKRQKLEDVLAAVIMAMDDEKVERAEAGIRKELKRLITSKNPRDIQKRKGWKGIKVEDKGNAEVVNVDLAAQDIGFFVKNYLSLRRRR